MRVAYKCDLFYRNLKVWSQFDVLEMGIPWDYSNQKGIKGNGKWDWAKLPVFRSLGMGWTNLYVNAASDIRSLQDLKGKKIRGCWYTIRA